MTDTNRILYKTVTDKIRFSGIYGDISSADAAVGNPAKYFVRLKLSYRNVSYTALFILQLSVLSL